jgi:ERCC4-related helicase
LKNQVGEKESRLGFANLKKKQVQTIDCRHSKLQRIYQIKEEEEKEAERRIVVFGRRTKQNLFLSCFL